MILVVDASVAAKWFLPEPLSDTAALLLEPRYDLVAPDLILLEVGGVLLRALRRDEIDLAEASEAFAARLPAAVRTFPAAEDGEAAFDIARRHGGTIYDAVYLALARRLEAPVITNDEGLVDVARKAKVRALMIGDGPP